MQYALKNKKHHNILQKFLSKYVSVHAVLTNSYENYDPIIISQLPKIFKVDCIVKIYTNSYWLEKINLGITMLFMYFGKIYWKHCEILIFYFYLCLSLFYLFIYFCTDA